MPNSLLDALLQREVAPPGNFDPDENARLHPLPPNPWRSGFEGGMDFLKGVVWPSMSNDASMAERTGGLVGAVVPILNKGGGRPNLKQTYSSTGRTLGELLGKVRKGVPPDDLAAEELYTRLMDFEPDSGTGNVVPQKVTGSYIPPRTRIVPPEGVEFPFPRTRETNWKSPTLELPRDPAIDAKRASQQDFIRRQWAILNNRPVDKMTSLDDLKDVRPQASQDVKKTMTISEQRAANKTDRAPKYSKEDVQGWMDKLQNWKGTYKAFASEIGVGQDTIRELALRYKIKRP